MKKISWIPLRRLLIGASTATMGTLACASGDETTLANPVSESPEGVTIRVQDESTLDGSFVSDGRSLDFTIERTEHAHTAALHGSDGTLLWRASFDSDSEKLELGDIVSLQAPVGSLFVTGQPRWENVRVEGDLSATSALLARPELALSAGLARALAEHPGIDPSFLSDLHLEAITLGTQAYVAGPDEGTVEKSHDPTGCAVCHATCSAAVLACIGVTWGPWAPVICVPPGIVCHIGCGTSACQ
jgi:hypothetical protein